MMISTTGLKRRGWTPFMVERLLGSPDQEVDSLDYRKIAPKQLWALARVEAIEATPEFAQMQATAKTRSERSRKGVQTKTNKLLAQVESMKVTIKSLPSDQVLSNAIMAFNSWPKGTTATRASDQHFLARITVNYIRDDLSECDTELEAAAIRMGSAVLRAAIWRRLFAAIAAAYPQYAEECDRQLAAKLAQS